MGRKQEAIGALRQQLDMKNQEYLSNHPIEPIKGMQVYKVIKGERSHPIDKEDVYNIRIELELADDVNDFIEEM